MPKGNGHIFISYRRDDSAGYTRAIYDRLVDRFSRDRVFMDVDAIEPGLVFDEVINRAVGRCEILLAIIGEDWMKPQADGASRIHAPKDFVRLEISAALSRNIRVIPVLLDGATMPAEDKLPEALRSLALRNAIEVSSTRFDSDVDRLVESVAKALGESRPASRAGGAARSKLRWIGAAIAIIAAIAAAPILYWDMFAAKPTDTQRSDQTPMPVRVADPELIQLESWLKDANILISTGDSADYNRVMGYLQEKNSPYKILAADCLKVIGKDRLVKTGYLDMIDKWYTQLIGDGAEYAPNGRLDQKTLKEAMIRAQNEFYGDDISSFPELLVPKP
jgi:TIR domain